jgi:hypothetical protein
MSKILALQLRNRILVTILLVPFLVGYLFFVLNTTASIPEDTSQYKEFTFQNGNISMYYPGDWIPGETPNGNHGDNETIALILVPGKASPHIGVAETSVSVRNINEVAIWGEYRSKSRGRYKEIQFYREVINSNEVIVREYLRTVDTLFGESTSKCRDVYFYIKNSGFSFSFCAYDREWERFAPVFDYMINSIEINLD